jgi:hypothetical protein
LKKLAGSNNLGSGERRDREPGIPQSCVILGQQYAREDFIDLSRRQCRQHLPAQKKIFQQLLGLVRGSPGYREGLLASHQSQ